MAVLHQDEDEVTTIHLPAAGDTTHKNVLTDEALSDTSLDNERCLMWLEEASDAARLTTLDSSLWSCIGMLCFDYRYLRAAKEFGANKNTKRYTRPTLIVVA